MSKDNENDGDFELVEIPGLGLVLEGGEKLGKALEKRGSKSVDPRTVQATSKLQKNVQTWVRRAAVADGKFDRRLETVISRGDRFLNDNKVGRAYANGMSRVANSKPSKYVAKTSEKLASRAVDYYRKKVEKKVAERAVRRVAIKETEKVVAKSTSKVVAKLVGKAVGKSLLKKIPILSAGVGIYYAICRFQDKEYWCAAGEFASGIAGCWPGIGSLISLGFDSAMGVYDVNEYIAQSKKTENIENANPVILPKNIRDEVLARTQEQYLKPVQQVAVSSQQMASMRAKDRLG